MGFIKPGLERGSEGEQRGARSSLELKRHGECMRDLSNYSIIEAVSVDCQRLANEKKTLAVWLNVIYIKYELHTIWTETSFSNRNLFPVCVSWKTRLVYFWKSNNKENLNISLIVSTHREKLLTAHLSQAYFYIHVRKHHTFLKPKWNRVTMLGAENPHCPLAMFPCRGITIVEVVLWLPTTPHPSPQRREFTDGWVIAIGPRCSKKWVTS